MATADYDVKLHLSWWLRLSMRLAWVVAGFGITVPAAWMRVAFKYGMKVKLCQQEN